MPADQLNSDKTKLKIIKQYLIDTEDNLLKNHPVVREWLEATRLQIKDLRNSPANTPVFSSISMGGATHPDGQDLSKDQNLVHNITLEEHQAVIYKLREVAKLSPGDLEGDDLLYLEQQLSDIFGFDVSSELENHKLPYIMGTLEALPHYRRFPIDHLDQHKSYLEAGMSKTRGGFDWMLEEGKLSSRAIIREKYGVSLPLANLKEWQVDHNELNKWYRFRKLLIINPFDLRAVVATIIDGGFISNLKYQFGATPEVIREGNIWSPGSSGKVLMFFINDKDDKVEHGPITLTV